MGIACSNKFFVRNSSIYIKSIQRSSNIKIPLSSKEVNILKKSWPLVKQNWIKICLVAFERWFVLYPQLRYMFRSLPSDLQFEDLFKSEALKKHVNKTREVIEMLIGKIDDVEDLVNTLIDLGRQHHMLGADQKYANALAASLQFGICMIMDVDPSVENAWDSLLRFVMNLLKFGIRLERDLQENAQNEKDIQLDNGNVNAQKIPEKTEKEGKDIHLVDYKSEANVRKFNVAEADPNG